MVATFDNGIVMGPLGVFSERGMLFHGEVRVPLKEEHVLTHQIRIGKPFFYVTKFQIDRLVNVSLGSVVVNTRLGSLQGGVDAVDGGQQLVIDLDRKCRRVRLILGQRTAA